MICDTQVFCLFISRWHTKRHTKRHPSLAEDSPSQVSDALKERQMSSLGCSTSAAEASADSSAFHSSLSGAEVCRPKPGVTFV